jgi:putative serine protease PepD
MFEGKSARPVWWSRPEGAGAPGAGFRVEPRPEAVRPRPVSFTKTAPDPQPAPPRPQHPVPRTAPADGPAAGPPANPYATPPAGTTVPTTATAPPAVPPPAPATPTPAAPAPTYRPDPYGTPPYGAPGPYAPAPPVQHPGVRQFIPHFFLPGPRPSAPPVPPPAAPWHRPALPAPQRAPRTGPLLLAVLVVALVAGLLGGTIGGYVQDGHGRETLPQAPAGPAGRAPGSVAGIARATLPGVVYIHVRGGNEEGTGTGFVLDGQGHILTNNHVVEPAADGGTIQVTLNDGQVRPAEVVGRDTGYDLAVIKVSGAGRLHPLTLGDSDGVQVGDPVVAIGAPFGLEGTVTSGIISAKNRPITAGGEGGGGSDVSYVDALQTDAPINPGNSGGPLVNVAGQVIGINSAIRSAAGGGGSPFDEGQDQGGSIGLGFAIPMNEAKRVAEELINDGRATHPVLGVELNMGYDGDGAQVSEGTAGGDPVTPGGPGDRAGLRPGDVITAVDGHAIHSSEELIVKIRSRQPGDVLRLTVERGGRQQHVQVRLAASTGG